MCAAAVAAGHVYVQVQERSTLHLQSVHAESSQRPRDGLGRKEKILFRLLPHIPGPRLPGCQLPAVPAVPAMPVMPARSRASPQWILPARQPACAQRSEGHAEGATGAATRNHEQPRGSRKAGTNEPLCVGTGQDRSRAHGRAGTGLGVSLVGALGTCLMHTGCCPCTYTDSLNPHADYLNLLVSWSACVNSMPSARHARPPNAPPTRRRHRPQQSGLNTQVLCARGRRPQPTTTLCPMASVAPGQNIVRVSEASASTSISTHISTPIPTPIRLGYIDWHS